MGGIVQNVDCRLITRDNAVIESQKAVKSESFGRFLRKNIGDAYYVAKLELLLSAKLLWGED